MALPGLQEVLSRGHGWTDHDRVKPAKSQGHGKLGNSAALAEHLLLDDVGAHGEDLADASGQFLVVAHVGFVSFA